MNNSDSTSFGSQVPSLFQIAAFFEDFFPSAGVKPPGFGPSHLPFAEYMLNPDKLMAVLRSGKTDGQGVKTSQKNESIPAKRGTRDMPPRKSAGQPGEGKTNGEIPKANGASPKTNGAPPGPLRTVEFRLESPSADSVKLAGDFTGWEASPIEMMHSGDGMWFTVVPLRPGQYTYRFIVDGQWYDDPASRQRVPNPFGSENAVINVP
jgi:hypothetical protein